MTLEQRRQALEVELGEPITLDGLSADFKIFQRRNGHRHSTDDLMTAWYALEQATPHRALDLGTGIGTVGLLMVSAVPALALTCIEAQDISYRFLTENIAANAVGDRVRAVHGDLRDVRLGETFPLVTGSPPYFDPRAGIVPADSQKAHARFELRGDVSDYARAAKSHLAGDGLFVFCFPHAQAERAVAAVRAENFSLVKRRDVIPRAGLTALFGLYVCKLGTHPEVVEPPFVVRDAAGEHTEMYRSVRRRFGWE